MFVLKMCKREIESFYPLCVHMRMYCIYNYLYHALIYTVLHLAHNSIALVAGG